MASHINRKSRNYILLFCITKFCNILLDTVTKLQSVYPLQWEKFKRKNQQRPNHTLDIVGLTKHMPNHVSCQNNGNVPDHEFIYDKKSISMMGNYFVSFLVYNIIISLLMTLIQLAFGVQI